METSVVMQPPGTHCHLCGQVSRHLWTEPRPAWAMFSLVGCPVNIGPDNLEVDHHQVLFKAIEVFARQ